MITSLFAKVASRRNALAVYILVILLTLVAHFLRLAIAPADGGIQYVTFFPAVALSAVIGGLWPGLFSALIGVALATYYFWPPYATFSLEYRYDMVLSNAVFLFDALLVCSAIEAMHRFYGSYMLAEKELREADRQKNEFLAMLGHELRNPLAAIRNSVELSKRVTQSTAAMNADEVKRQAIGIIDRQSHHMTRLVNDLLDITRVTRNKLELHRQPTALQQSLQDVTGALQAQLESAGLRLTVDVPEEVLWLDADPERLVQMLDNLLRNAIKFTDPGGRITVTVRRQGDLVRIAIRDTGIGIDPEQAEGLFEPYRQLAGVGRSDGLGLGLALVKRLAEMHGGRVTAHSEGLGKGSEFVLALPLAENVSRMALHQVHRLPPRQRVLIVDDEADVADSFASLLRALGQEVAVAYSGKEAIQSALQYRPQVAFLDLSMPGMGGSALSRLLRERFPVQDLTLVALSGQSTGAAIEQGGEFQYHLLKPVDGEKLQQLLSKTGDTAS